MSGPHGCLTGHNMYCRRSRQYAASTLAGSAAFVILAQITSASVIRGFENPSPGWFEQLLGFWTVLQLSLPGVAAGLLAPSRAFVCGLLAYAAGLALLLGFEVVQSHRLLGHFVPALLAGRIQYLLLKCLIGGLIAHVVARIRRRRSSYYRLGQS